MLEIDSIHVACSIDQQQEDQAGYVVYVCVDLIFFIDVPKTIDLTEEEDDEAVVGEITTSLSNKSEGTGNFLTMLKGMIAWPQDTIESDLVRVKMIKRCTREFEKMISTADQDELKKTPYACRVNGPFIPGVTDMSMFIKVIDAYEVCLFSFFSFFPILLFVLIGHRKGFYQHEDQSRKHSI